MNQIFARCHWIKHTSDGTRAVIGYISGPYSTVRSSAWPAKFEYSMKHSLASFFFYVVSVT